MAPDVKPSTPAAPGKTGSRQRARAQQQPAARGHPHCARAPGGGGRGLPAGPQNQTELCQSAQQSCHRAGQTAARGGGHRSEKLVHPPDCFQASDSQPALPASLPSRAELGLPENAVVFCCFNNPYKITAAIFDVWMRLLRSVPGSVLWLVADNRWAEANLQDEARQRGVEPARLIFSLRVDYAALLARQHAADLFSRHRPLQWWRHQQRCAVVRIARYHLLRSQLLLAHDRQPANRHRPTRARHPFAGRLRSPGPRLGAGAAAPGQPAPQAHT